MASCSTWVMKKGIGADYQPSCSHLLQHCEGRVDTPFIARMQNVNLLPQSTTPLPVGFSKQHFAHWDWSG